MLTRSFPGRASTVAVCFAASWLTGNNSSGNDWPTFRGTGRTAVSRDTGLLQEWSQGGPPLVWETQGAGRGYASLAVARDRIYTLGDGPSTADDKDEYLVCFERATGKQVWKAKTGPAW